MSETRDTRQTGRPALNQRPHFVQAYLNRRSTKALNAIFLRSPTTAHEIITLHQLHVALSGRRDADVAGVRRRIASRLSNLGHPVAVDQPLPLMPPTMAPPNPPTPVAPMVFMPPVIDHPQLAPPPVCIPEQPAPKPRRRNWLWRGIAGFVAVVIAGIGHSVGDQLWRELWPMIAPHWLRLKGMVAAWI